jgi:hypothetical protein
LGLLYRPYIGRPTVVADSGLRRIHKVLGRALFAAHGGRFMARHFPQSVGIARRGFFSYLAGEKNVEEIGRRRKTLWGKAL